MTDFDTLAALERRVLWLASWTIHAANHLRPADDLDVKVGGHQASCASMATLMTALYFHVLRPEDRVAVKPHAGPVFHAIQYLAGRQSRAQLEAFRAFGGAQSYPSRTKDKDDVDFSTGSVGLGVAQTLFSSLVQDYVRAHGWGTERPEGRMVALVGDAEMDEGNIYEALLEGWKQGVRNLWWVVDYNRQSLDAVIREGLWAKLETSSPTSAGTSSSSATAASRRPPSPSPAARASATGSRPARTSSIPPSPSRAARRGASACSTTSATRARSRRSSNGGATPSSPR